MIEPLAARSPAISISTALKGGLLKQPGREREARAAFAAAMALANTPPRPRISACSWTGWGRIEAPHHETMNAAPVDGDFGNAMDRFLKAQLGGRRATYFKEAQQAIVGADQS